MDDILKRFLLFLIGCMGTRFMFVIVAKKINRKYLPYLGYLALIFIDFQLCLTPLRPGVGVGVEGKKLNRGGEGVKNKKKRLKTGRSGGTPL